MGGKTKRLLYSTLGIKTFANHNNMPPNVRSAIYQGLKANFDITSESQNRRSLILYGESLKTCSKSRMYYSFIRGLLGPFLESFETRSLKTAVGWASNGSIDVGVAVLSSEARTKEAVTVGTDEKRTVENLGS